LKTSSARWKRRPGAGPKQKAQSDKLVELQKQIVNATWRIIRDTNAGRVMEAAAPDVDVVHQSQGIALEQTKEAMEKVEDAEAKNALTEAWKSMKDALDPLQQASEEKKRSPLNQALTFEQSALEWLHRAQSREHQVMRQNSPPQPGAGQQANKNQLMDLELKQKEQRYEEEKAATEEQTAEQQENLQVLNRLKELARRQEALAEKMKELQNQLARPRRTRRRKNSKTSSSVFRPSRSSFFEISMISKTAWRSPRTRRTWPRPRSSSKKPASRSTMPPSS
jgi:hypothetical protein